jgi:DNA-3-methyladenine glycosylase
MSASMTWPVMPVHGRTPRTAVMYGPPGRAYVYFTYGMHWLLNAVCLPEGEPAAVLIRAIQPIEGLDVIAVRRNGQPPVRWTDGPGKICQALGIDGSLNGAASPTLSAGLWIEGESPFPMSMSVLARGLASTPHLSRGRASPGATG